MTTSNATIQLTLEAVRSFPKIASELEAAGFPVLSMDLRNGSMVVNPSSDPDEYSVLMAAIAAAEAAGIDGDEVIYAKIS